MTKMNRSLRYRRAVGAVLAGVAAAAALAASAPAAPSAEPAPSAPSATLVPAAGATQADLGAPLRAEIDTARTHLIADYRSIDARTGLADALESRMDVDESSLFEASRPSTDSPADFWERNAAMVGFDHSLVLQLAAGKAHPLGAVRGLDDIPLPTAAGGMLAPCAIDVPADVTATRPVPLVVLIHAQATSESSELAEPLFRSLAEQTGAIVIAPYAQGDDVRSRMAADDVYAAVGAVESAFPVDRGRVYLVGDALGGVAAFEIATWRPDQWSGILAIRSTMDASDTNRVSAALSGKPIYIVAGTADAQVPIDGVRRSVTWFRGIGIAPMYYEASNATHDLSSLSVAVRQAWTDMLAGKKALLATPIPLPTPTPPPSGHP